MLLLAIFWVIATHFLKSTYTGILSLSGSAGSPPAFTSAWLSSVPFNGSASAAAGARHKQEMEEKAERDAEAEAEAEAAGNESHWAVEEVN